MDQSSINAVTEIVTRIPSRRDALRALAGAGLGLGGLRMAHSAEAGKRKTKNKDRTKRKRRKSAVNQFGCLEVGQPCNGDSTRCCSGICQGRAPRKGKKDASRCAGHNAGICAVSFNMCTTGSDAFCGVENPNCHCTLSTGNAAFCADFSNGARAHCRVCTRDTDCQAEFGPGTACVVFDGICAAYCPTTGGTACMPTCPV